MLYNRDYRYLTNEETEKWHEAKKLLNKSKENGISPKVHFKYYEILPKAVIYHKTIFPNNYLHIDDLKDKNIIQESIKNLSNLLNDDANERDILNYIKDSKFYFIIGSIFQYGFIHFNFGHHKAFLFREFPLGTNHIVDFLLIGKNSGGYEFIFIELESPKGAVTMKNGEFGEVIRKGISQVKDWNRWLEANFSSLYSEFEKHLGNYKKNLPKEFHILDKSRLHYVVVAGKRQNYTEKTYTLRRELFKENNITLIHYDNLLDSIQKLNHNRNY